jgi:ribonuclease VapC
MVIDTSAVIAILEDEDDAHTFAYAIAAASIRRMSAPNLFECSLVALRRGEANLALLDSIVRNAAVEVVAFAPADLEFARDAYRRFGRGRHAAALNFGDCFAYGLAKRLEEPLLFKGDEFTRTDVCSALA